MYLFIIFQFYLVFDHYIIILNAIGLKGFAKKKKIAVVLKQQSNELTSDKCT